MLALFSTLEMPDPTNLVGLVRCFSPYLITAAIEPDSGIGKTILKPRLPQHLSRLLLVLPTLTVVCLVKASLMLEILPLVFWLASWQLLKTLSRIFLCSSTRRILN